MTVAEEFRRARLRHWARLAQRVRETELADVRARLASGARLTDAELRLLCGLEDEPRDTRSLWERSRRRERGARRS